MSEPILYNLAKMQARGSSVTLNWGEDDGLWECSWITSGKRYTAFSRDPSTAIDLCLRDARLGLEDVEFSP